MRIHKREHLNTLFNNYTFENMTDVAVVVDSRGGNTRKVEDAIAEEMRIKVKDVTTMILPLRSPMRQDRIQNSRPDSFT